ncbi:unnamed protein product [Adineta steineri]|uniref:Uncharacterized protein n=1 Tax=Adineta steineri TaxID=433720 RepID=A0A815L8G7_9BILA|nr:unnamed protein product [Adineta steineri]
MIQDLPNYLTSNSIRRLDLLSGHYLKRNLCFNTGQCTTFLRSSLMQSMGLDSGEITIYLYTLPYTFSFFSFIPNITNICTLSTCPNKDDICINYS